MIVVTLANMIKGIGIDIVEIKRVQKLIGQYKNKFLERTFTPIEIQYCSNKPDPAQHFAGKFAAKEALIKSFGRPLVLKEIEVANSPKGVPFIKLTGSAKKLLKNRKILLAVSHDHEYAVAQALLQ